MIYEKYFKLYLFDGVKNQNSLQATMLKNTILHALRQVAPLAKVQALPGNFVYQFPTIQSLANYAVAISRPQEAAGLSNGGNRQQHIDHLIKKYTHQWPIHTPQKGAFDENEDREVVFLTGSTGGLGSQLLARLLASRKVSRVYAFNRPGQKSSYERHLEVFTDRGNDVELLRSAKLVFVEGDTSTDGFGITPELFTQVRWCLNMSLPNPVNDYYN